MLIVNNNACIVHIIVISVCITVHYCKYSILYVHWALNKYYYYFIVCNVW